MKLRQVGVIVVLAVMILFCVCLLMKIRQSKEAGMPEYTKVPQSAMEKDYWDVGKDENEQ